MSSIFSKIIAGEIPAYKIAENENFLAFLDVMPLVEGHVLVVPKTEVDYIFNMSPSEFKDLWAFAQTIAPAIEKAIPCKRIGIAVIGLEVPHAHIHLVPLNKVGDINFSQSKISVTQDQLKATAEKIRAAL